MLLQDLMTLGFDSAILLISSYANPVDTLHHARNHGYQVTDFMVTPMPFGYYSSEPKVPKLFNHLWPPCTVSTRQVDTTEHAVYCRMKLLCCCKAVQSDMSKDSCFCMACQLLNGSDVDQVIAAHDMLRCVHVGTPACKKVCLVHGHVP